MKVAVSAQGDDIESLVDPRFGRAAWIIIIDSDSGEWTAIDNSESAGGSGGAGAQAGPLVVGAGVQSVITGNVGPNAHRVLTAAGVGIYQAGNGVTVREAIRSLEAETLEKVGAPTVAGHWA